MNGRRLAIAIAFGCIVGRARADELLVRGFLSGTFLRYDDATGAFLGTIDTDLPGANAVVRGPDGDLFAASGANEIRRYDGETGALRGRFVWDDPATPDDESHGLDHATGLAFGPDGNLYAAGYVSNSVIRYDGRTGAFIDVFVAPRSGGLNGADIGMEFGPDGNLYVASQLTDSILRYDGNDGHFIDAFVPALRGGLRRPSAFVFRPDGFLYVSSTSTDRVLRFNATTGAFDRGFVSVGSGGLDAPTGLAFGPDGNLYVSSAMTNSVLRFDGATGAFIDEFVHAGAGGLMYPTGLLFSPSFHLRLGAPSPGVAGMDNALRVEGATPSGSIVFVLGTAPGQTHVPGCAGVALDLASPRVVGTATADAFGIATLTRFVPSRLQGRQLAIEVVERSTCRASRLLEFVFR